MTHLWYFCFYEDDSVPASISKDISYHVEVHRDNVQLNQVVIFRSVIATKSLAIPTPAISQEPNRLIEK